MTLIRGIDIVTRQPRDIVCDEQGRLIAVILGGEGGMVSWGEIAGTITAQSDLITLLANTYVALAAPGTITARHTFNPAVPGAPFIVGANAAGQFVAGLNADLLDDQEGAYYLDRTNHTGQIPTSAVTDFLTEVNTAVAAYLAANPAFPGDVTFDGDTVTFNSSVDFTEPITVSAVMTFEQLFALDPTIQGVLVVGLNADLLDGQQGSFYLDRANHTGTITIADVQDLQFELDARDTSGLAVLAGNNTFSANNTFNGTVVLGDVVSKTTTDLVTNFNADLLDGQQGVYYLDRANHVGDIAIADVIGLQAALDSALLASVDTDFTALLTFDNPDYDGVSPIEVGAQFNQDTRLTIQPGAVVEWGITGLITNLNADQLDGQHGEFYLDRENHTGTQEHTTVSDFNLGVHEVLADVDTLTQTDVVVEFASPLYYARDARRSNAPREVWMTHTEFFNPDIYGDIPAESPGIVWNETLSTSSDPNFNDEVVSRRWRKVRAGETRPEPGVDFASDIEYLDLSVATNNTIEAICMEIALAPFYSSGASVLPKYVQLLSASVVTRYMQIGITNSSNKYNAILQHATDPIGTFTNFVNYTPGIPTAREAFFDGFGSGDEIFVEITNEFYAELRVANIGSPGRANTTARLAYRWWKGA